MLDDNLLTAASSIRANQAGNLTETQRELLKNKIGSLPVLVFMGAVVGLFMLALAVGGNLLLDYPLLLLPLMAVIILAVFGLNRLYGDLMIRLRFSDLALEQIPGHITWKGDHYQAEANGRSLEPITRALNLLPGRYTFFVLRGTAYLLSAALHEASAGPQTFTAKPDLDEAGLAGLHQALEKAGVRRSANLDANRLGLLAAQQRTMLVRGVIWNIVWLALLSAFLVGCLIAFLAQLTMDNVVNAGFVAAGVGILLYVLLDSLRKQALDLRGGRLEIAEGWVTKSTSLSGGPNSRRYFYEVDHHKLMVSEAAYNALLEGSYRLYWLPVSRLVVNIEALN